MMCGPFWTRLAQSEHHSSELPKAAQCPFFMPQLIPNARPHWSYMVPMPDDRGLPIILSVGRTNSGNVYLTISNAIGANHSREAWQRVSQAWPVTNMQGSAWLRGIGGRRAQVLQPPS